MAVHRTLLLTPLMGLENGLQKHCVPVVETNQSHQVTKEFSGMFTWKPQNSIFVTIIKHNARATAIYVHDSDMHYAASEAASLGSGCPVNTVLLAQVALEHTGVDSFERQEYRIVVLLFDVLQIGSENFVASKMPPEQRYRRLRLLCDGCNKEDVIMSPSTMLVQWAGPSLDVVREFSMGPHASKNLPNHSTESIICLGREHPCKLSLVFVKSVDHVEHE